jgi:hypothetical protein
LPGFPFICDSIFADVEHGLSPMDEFAMNLATGRVDHGYLKVLIVDKATIEEMPRENAAMRNRLWKQIAASQPSISASLPI